jgi:hypothetical protein
VRLACLRFVNVGHLHIHIPPGVGFLRHSFSLCFVGLDIDEGNRYFKRKKNPGLCLRLDLEAV